MINDDDDHDDDDHDLDYKANLSSLLLASV